MGVALSVSQTLRCSTHALDVSLFDVNAGEALTETRQLPRIVAAQSVFLDGQVALRTMGWQLTPVGWTTASLGADAMTNIMNPPKANDRTLRESAVIEGFLESPNEDSFAGVYRVVTPHLVAFFRSRGCGFALSEDLTQEVMLTVYRKAAQIRDRSLFRAWLFRVARNALCRQCGKQSREVETVDLANVAGCLVASINKPAGTPAFEFHDWMAFLESSEREALTLRFVEEWEYHEIAAAKNIPIGTVQWRVFNAKKKLAPHLKSRQISSREAA